MADLIILLPILGLMLLLALGVPVAYSLMISGTVGLAVVIGFEPAFSLITTTMYSASSNWLYSTVPMFILMAELLSVSGLTRDVYKATHYWTARIKGGLAIATTIANGGMAALSGSSTATAATMAKIAVPEMREYGYSEKLSMGTVSAAGTFAIMIPPSLGLIIYGVFTETSIPALFTAGVIPGILTLISYIMVISIWGIRYPDAIGVTGESYSLRRKLRVTSHIYPAILLILLVLGGLYGGIVTATEAGAIGAAGAFVITLGFYGLDMSDLSESLGQTLKTTTMIFLIIIGALIFGRYLTVTRITQDTIAYVGNLALPPMAILLFLLVIYVFLGTFLDQTAVLLLTLPLTYPLVVEGLGYGPVWFGVIIVKTVEIGLVTPPLGLNVYVAAGAVDVDLENAFAGALRFLLADFVVLALLLLFPEIVTYLPSTMG